jgi:hypothetical protein
MRNHLSNSPITGKLHAPRGERPSTGRHLPAVTARGREILEAARKRSNGTSR